MVTPGGRRFGLVFVAVATLGLAGPALAQVADVGSLLVVHFVMIGKATTYEGGNSQQLPQRSASDGSGGARARAGAGGLAQQRGIGCSYRAV